jgi:hypothetical protein
LSGITASRLNTFVALFIYVMKHFITRFALLVGYITGSLTLVAQNQQAVVTTLEGGKVFMQLGLPGLQADLDSLFSQSAAQSSSLQNLSWSDVLGLGTNPGVNVDFFGHTAHGLGHVTTTGTFTGDSLVLNKDATISGRLQVAQVAYYNDSLRVAGHTRLHGNLQVDGTTNLGSSLSVTGNTSIGGDLAVAGETQLADTLHAQAPALFSDSVYVAGNMGIAGGLEVNSLMINGVTIPALDDTDALPEGSNQLYYTDARARAAFSGGTGVNVTSGTISIGQAVATTSDVTFDAIAADSLALTSVLSVAGKAMLSDSLLVSSGVSVAGTLDADSAHVEGLNVTRTFRFADGSEGANKVLQSNASGQATWVTLLSANPYNPSAVVLGALDPGAPAVASNTAAYWTGSYIDLPPGDWAVQATSIIQSDAVRGPGGSYSNSTIWVRSYFSTSSTSVVVPTTLTGGIIAGSQTYPEPFGLATGLVVIRNSGTTTQRYYWWAGANEVYSTNPAATLYYFGGSQWGETSLIAFAVQG